MFDAQEPDALRGRLRSVAEDQEAIFVSGEDLVRCMHQMAQSVTGGDVTPRATDRPIA